MKSAIGVRQRRNEDAQLLTGKGLFVDDVHLPGMLEVAFVRSTLAHARILSVRTEEARTVPGVVAIYVAEDLGELNAAGPLLVPPPPIAGCEFFARTQTPLAHDFVRHVGEALAMVVAVDRYVAEDAAELVECDLDPLPVVADLVGSLADGAPRVHSDLESNLAARVLQEKGDAPKAFEGAALVVAERFEIDRGCSAPMENRGVVAHWQPASHHLTVWDTTQAPIPIRNGLAARLGLSEFDVRVVAPFIGGGFGPKIMMFYPEEVLIPWAAMQLGAPVKWIEDREESFFATTQERSQVHHARMALDESGRILGVEDRFLHDSGAFSPYGLTVPINSQCTLLGPYKVPAYRSEFEVAFTNKPTVTPYRGAGRPHGVFVMERLLDLAARQLGLDPVEIRRRNLLQPDDFPHNHELIYQDFNPLIYDSGNYPAVLDKAVEAIGWRDFVEGEQPRLRALGRHVGIGLVSYVEGTGIGPYEGARVTVEASGQVNVATGVGTQGQGHATVFAQVVSEQLSTPVERIRVVTGDTGEFHWGTGTFASRGAVVAGSACHEAALRVRHKILKLASETLEAAPEDLVLENGSVAVVGSPERTIGLGELALLANPLRGGVAPGSEPGLEATAYFGPEQAATSAGVHAMILEVDAETGMVEIRRYVVVHDCGRVLNPLLLEGQIEGGVAQGIGNAFYEQLVFDDQAQLLNASFMDYLLPGVSEVPSIESHHVETPSPNNPLGTKGAGEAGAIPVIALFAQAIENALDLEGFAVKEMPLSPRRLWELIAASRHPSTSRTGE